jgi:hypothetical protein
MRFAAIGRAALPAGSCGVLRRQAPRKRRGLTIGPTASGLEVFFQSLVFASQAGALDLGPPQIFLEAFNAAGLVVDDLLGRTRRRVIWAPRHARVIADRGRKYKSKNVAFEH